MDENAKAVTSAVPERDRAEKKLLSALGLAAKAGKLVWGTQNVCDALKAGRARLVVEAQGNSENTQKRLSDRCAYYRVAHELLPADAAELGWAIGRGTEISSAAVTDENFAGLIRRALEGVRQTIDEHGTQNGNNHEKRDF